ncbi:MAG: DNA mismatch repair endonuclease MutL [Ruminococcaceae bacterium]|nr:DNA mismatch repair endonuclease MutL [Oscillospiraceae bacterium]
MGRINQLDFKVANLIAAGEVVDRPSSAVKELLENAIDAGAENITVELKRGGVCFIRITDDGCGMSEDDVSLCILRHATSKIKYATDLDGITTLGFRGEALAAIAAVSRLRIMTRTRDSEMGTVLESEGGTVSSVTSAGCQVGTTVIVEDLFANVPARRKFLKRDVSEGMACCAVVEKIALSHPEISFKLITDGQMRYMTDGKGDLYSAIYAVLGREFSKKLIRVESLMEGVSVYGFIGQPDNTRSNRNFQNFFINGRYVRSRTAMSAIEQAYESFIPSDKFPSCVLNIKIHPAFVDVNVHPTKLEVKFSDEKKVFDAVYCAVRNALESSVRRPEMKIEPASVSYEDIKLKNAFVPIYDHADKVLSQKPEQKIFFDQDEKPSDTKESETVYIVESEMEKDAPIDVKMPVIVEEPKVFTVESEPEKETVFTEEEKEKEPKEEERFEHIPEVIHTNTPLTRPIEKTEIPYYKIIGEAFNSYVFVELQDKMLMIDKHAAHERIIFETMKRNMQKSDTAQQILMLPIDISLSPNELAAVTEYDKDIRSIGFDYSCDEGNCSLAVYAIPSQLEEAEAKAMLEVLAQQLSVGIGTAEITKNLFMEKALYQASCKASIKAGRIEDVGHVKWICDNLLSLPDIKFCPHGRPVAIELSKKEMEKQFKRI